MSEHQWFYTTGPRKRVGPISQAELIRLAASGEIQLTTKVVSPTATDTEWVEFQSVTSLVDGLNPPSTPVPAPASQSAIPAAHHQHQWFYFKQGWNDDQRIGPVDEPVFLQQLREGEIKPNWLVGSPTRTNQEWMEAQNNAICKQAITEGDLARKDDKAQAKNRKVAEREAKQREKERQRQLAEAAKQQAEAEQRQIELHQQQIALQQQPTAPVQGGNQTIVVQNSESNLVPILLNMFCFPGLGQLVQGRVLAAIIWWTLSALAAFSLLIFIGIVLVPLVYVGCIVDAALYKGGSNVVIHT